MTDTTTPNPFAQFSHQWREPDKAQTTCVKCGAYRHLSSGMFQCRAVTTEEQRPPAPSDGPDCWLLVMEDMKERRAMGIRKYGVPVRPGNGRDPLIDLYQELLDACVYVRQEIEDRGQLADKIRSQDELIRQLSERCHKQSELLSKAAEKK